MFTKARETTGGLYSAFGTSNVGTICDRNTSGVSGNRLLIVRNTLDTNFRCPSRGFFTVACDRISCHPRGSGGGGGAKRRVCDLSRLTPNSCIMRGIRNVNIFNNVEGVSARKIVGSCVGVSCTGNSILCIPIARLSVITGCVKPGRSSEIGLGQLNSNS